MIAALVLVAALAAPDAPAEIQLGQAPPALSWQDPNSLPKAETRLDGTFLPTGLDEEVLRHLTYAEKYPAMCQAALDAQKKAYDARLLAEAEAAKAQLDAERGWPTWVVVGGVVLGIVGGAYATHALLSK